MIAPMRRNALIVLLLGVLALGLIFLGRALLAFFAHIGTREVVIVLLIAGTVALVRLIRQMARRV
jgi:hypothetical protein